MYTIAECDSHISQITTALERARRGQTQAVGGESVQYADVGELEKQLAVWKRRKAALVNGPGPRMVAARPGRW